MTAIVFLLVLGGIVLTVVKAAFAARLAEKDPQAFELWDRAETEKRRRRNEMLGNVVLNGSRTVKAWFTNKE